MTSREETNPSDLITLHQKAMPESQYEEIATCDTGRFYWISAAINRGCEFHPHWLTIIESNAGSVGCLLNTL